MLSPIIVQFLQLVLSQHCLNCKGCSHKTIAYKHPSYVLSEMRIWVMFMVRRLEMGLLVSLKDDPP